MNRSAPDQESPISAAARDAERPEKLWRSLEELERSAELEEALKEEFPGALEMWPDSTSRRDFLHRMGASFALAGLAGCGGGRTEKIVTPVETTTHAPPGQSRSFATSMPIPGGAIGLLATSRDGRPTKLEGNPQHPASLGATDLFAQASILDLYDPDRSRVVRHHDRIGNWADFAAELKDRLVSHREQQGAGLHVLTGNTTSPTLLRQLVEFGKEFPRSAWHEFESFPDKFTRDGARLAFGRVLSPRYHLQRADVVLSLDADFLTAGPAKLRLAREFAKRRRAPISGKGNPPRLYMAESVPTLTGAAADHRVTMRPDAVRSLLASVAERLEVENAGNTGPFDDVPESWLNALVTDLRRAGKRGLVIVGPSQPAEVHALAHAVNASLGSLHSTVELIEPVDREPDQIPKSIGELAAAIEGGEVRTLLILDTNPAYAAPGDLGFADLLSRVPFTAHVGLYRDETARRCDWHIPLTHYLESWGDSRAEDGSAGLQQPLIAPLHNGKSSIEVLNTLLGQDDRSALESVRETWKRLLPEDGFERAWKRTLHDGTITGDTAVSKPVAANLSNEFQSARGTPERGNDDDAERGEPRFDLVFRADPTIDDGRYANNGWLQELPKPLTTQTWGNAAWINPADADDRGLSDGDVVAVRANGAEISLPVIRVPGQPKRVIALYAGHGRRDGGRNSEAVGVDVNPLRTSRSPYRATGTLAATGAHVELATTQNHFLMEGRDLVRRGTWEQFHHSPQHPPFMSAGGHHPPIDADGGTTLYPKRPEQRPEWGMTINLGSCTGCSACVVACQSENNIPIVGPDEVRRGREMHWIRVDTYHSGTAENPQTFHQPVPCMHCEHAPCEPVCPVAATTHSDEGLNEMTYNRCIGTRYCSNNCPYKVRRFNFLDYREEVKETPLLQLLQNPEVSVRSRGVMEKCTYCVQRISAARIAASMENREIRDGEVVTACQAVCPSEAIVFGDIADADSAVAKAKSHPLNYGLLAELNTRPRTTYHAALSNPSPDLEPRKGDA